MFPLVPIEAFFVYLFFIKQILTIKFNALC
ncbi:Uncharacterised protein [Yersinia similis]|nr:Uncharacterised protein [Yersinia similis]